MKRSRIRRLNLLAVKRYQQTAKGKRARRRYARSKSNLFYQRIWRKHLSKQEAVKAKLALLDFRNKCECCGTDKTDSWHLDHKGRKFRGILCRNCNVALGFISDSVERCYCLIVYLRSHQ